MQIIDNLFKYDNGLNVLGLTKELNIFYLVSKFNREDRNLLIVTSTLYEANNYYQQLCTHLDTVYLFPMDDFLASMVIATSPELEVKRLETLKRIAENKKSIVITNLTGYLKFLPDLNASSRLTTILKKGQTINREKLEQVLIEFGFKKESIVTTTGEYALRGFIVDIFLPLQENPMRVEFFGNEIEDIRYFDAQTQLSQKAVSEINLIPTKEVKTNLHSSLVDYLNNPIIGFINYDQIEQANLKLESDIVDYKEENKASNETFMFEFGQINPKSYFYINTFSDVTHDEKKTLKLDAHSLEDININNLENLVFSYLYTGKTVIICLSNKNEINKIQDIITKNLVITTEDNIQVNKVNIIPKKINEGFIIDKYVFICEFDIDSTLKKKIEYKNTYKIGRKIKDFGEINIGDYVVHRIYGIGIYNGLITLSKTGLKKDYLQILYKDNDKIYVPVEKISTIYRYASKEGAKPKINKLGTTTWQKTKLSMRSKIKDISAELLKMYASRAQAKREGYQDAPEESMFEHDFIYDETEDQLKAISDIDIDLKNDIPMDRLLCGDVGFGKTEVAFRAMFKAIINGDQVAYLCPTTILSNQQYNLALSRFAKYGINIAILNRYVNTKEKKCILCDLESGKLDLVFGTHRLLSSDVKFKKLGLLVVDEEQRFGVTHKEKIKSLKENVHVLTLSATPIPRTMKMALSGLRDLSIIDTPPINRYPVQTYVLAENDLIVKDAIYKELSRNGQVFILCNNISKIEDQASKIRKLVPESRVKFAHGRMDKDDLETIMQDFIEYKFDVLLCTTIIETGIDIANTNTLIVYNADYFGLSQLYQLRGRVGRGDKIAYAYLMYNPVKMLNDTAVKRLQAIKEFTELGSGYRIAMRDLSIRGAGDLLGSEQAGFVDSVGIELYTKMIEEEIKKIKGEYVEEEETLENSLLEVETHIKDSYVDEEKLKIEIHSKINEIKDFESLNRIKRELEDRFGKVDDNLLIYMYEEWFEKMAKSLNIKNIKQTAEFIEIELTEKISNTIKGDKLLLFANQITTNFNLRYRHQKIYIKLLLRNLDKHFIYYIVDLFTKLFPGK